MKIHWPAVGAAAVSTLAFVAQHSDTVAQFVPPKYAWTLAVVGIAAQALTKPVPKAA